jgi:hypothetical protein
MKRRTFLGAVSGAAAFATLGGAARLKAERLTGWRREVDRVIRKNRDLYCYIRLPIGNTDDRLLTKLLCNVNATGFGAIGAGCLRITEYSTDLTITGRETRRDFEAEFAYRAIPWNQGVVLTADGWVDIREKGIINEIWPVADFALIPDASEEEYRKWREKE